MNEKRLYTLLYGEDGCSGFIGTLRMEGKYDKEMADAIKNSLEKLVINAKDTGTVPADDVAALSDMFIDLVANTDVGKEVEEFLNETTVMIQKLYRD